MNEWRYYLDGFAGYGGFRKGFEDAGFKFKKVWFSEIDKYAIANYKYNFPGSEYAGSITDIQGLPKLDLFTFGWPCQDNSIAGKRKGQRDGTRSGLLLSAISCIERFKPRNFVAENVPGLLSVNGGIDIVESFRLLTYLNDSLPQYDVEMQLLNTRWFLPQNRERLFFVGHLRGESRGKVFPIEARNYRSDETTGQENKFVLPLKTQSNWTGKHIVAMRGRENGQELEISKGDYTNTLTSVQKDNLVIQKDYTKENSQGNRVYDINGSSICISSQGGGQGAKTGLYEVGDRIRRLTPIECERLQGLPDNWTKLGNFDGVVKEISDTQRYRLCGNGVSIPVIKEIGTRLLF